MDAIQLTLLISQYANTDIVLSIDAMSKMLNWDMDKTNDTISYLLEKRFIAIDRAEYIVTTEGYDWLYQKTKYNNQKWKTEVLTGLRQVKNAKTKSLISVRSNINNAVMPRQTGTPVDHRSPEDNLISQQEIMVIKKKVMRSLRISEKTYEQLMKNGCIYICDGYDKKSHIGVFANDGNTLCKRCQKRKENERKKKTKS